MMQKDPRSDAHRPTRIVVVGRRVNSSAALQLCTFWLPARYVCRRGQTSCFHVSLGAVYPLRDIRYPYFPGDFPGRWEWFGFYKNTLDGPMIPALISGIVKQRHCDDIAYFQEPLNEVHGMLGGWLVDEGGEKKMIGLSVFLTN